MIVNTKAKITLLLVYKICLIFPIAGLWLCGLLVSGELFLWNRDKDLLKTATAVPEMLHLMAAVQGIHNRKIVTTCSELTFDSCALSHSCCV